MTIVVGAREARQKFADILGRVGFGKEVAIVERSGKPLVAIIPLDLYDQLVVEREARFQVLDRIRSRMPEIQADEVLMDVSRAIEKVRGKGASSRR